MNDELMIAAMPSDTSDGTASPVANLATVRDRRRPERLDRVSPALIPLLRDATGSDDIEDDLAPMRGIMRMRGIMFAAPFAVLLWFLIGVAVWRVL
jgi:hypothetical protein